MSNDEPEYLKALRRNQEQRSRASEKQESGAGASATPNPAEREALRWAREVGGREVRVPPFAPGSKTAILIQPITPFGNPPVSLEWHPTREALADRIRTAQGAGENVVGSYELTTGRPLTHELAEGKVSFSAGEARRIMKAESPERMIRKASKMAEQLAKTRKVEDFSRGGRRGGSGGGGGPGGGRGGPGGGRGGPGGGRGGPGGGDRGRG